MTTPAPLPPEACVLQTERLVLRPPREEDAESIQILAAAREIAANTLSIPHPYPPGGALEWIAKSAEKRAAGTDYHFVIELRATGQAAGVIGLHLQGDFGGAELGYWIGVPHWNQGYVTEGARAVLDFAFGPLGLRRVYAHHFLANAASGRILRKLGMQYEGRLRQHIIKWDEPIDLECYGILASDPRPAR